MMCKCQENMSYGWDNMRKVGLRFDKDVNVWDTTEFFADTVRLQQLFWTQHVMAHILWVR